ncbi:MAG: hypothetical protein IKC07_01470 [Clostridia bacterium]|nr:hypothetical protein [Clostridia bacterium]
MNGFEKIDVKQILKMFLKNIKIIIASVLIFAVAFFAYNEFMVTPKYRSSVSLYLNNNDERMKSEDKVLGTDISASQMLIPSCIEIVKSNRMLNEVSKDIKKTDNLEYTARQIGGMVSVSSTELTEIFRISITSADPKHSEIIANAFAKIAPDVITKIIGATSVNVIDYALYNPNPINQSGTKKAVTGMIVGLIIACAFILLRELLDVRIKNESDLEKLFDYPILGVIPKIGERNSGQESYYYRNSYYRSGKGGAYYGGAKKTKSK